MALTNSSLRRRFPAALGAAVILTATLALGAFSGSASAGDRRDDHRGYDHRGGGWGGGYYRAPPVVYGSPYYAPPVVYGPGFGINLNIR